MDRSFSNKKGIAVVNRVIKTIKENRDYLTKVDAAVGDGDHGINMFKGFSLAEAELSAEKDYNMSKGFLIISQVLMSKIGGSMGPLYGNFFLGLSIASKDEENIDQFVFGEMLTIGYRKLSELTSAGIGDKTLIDVLDPAVDVYIQLTQNPRSFEESLTAMVESARKGLESTKELVAVHGRGSRLGERAKGYQDAGGTSCYLILQAMSEEILELIKT